MNRFFVYFSFASILSTTLALLPARVEAETPTYAIIVGHNGSPEGRDDLKPLHFADDDALRFYGLLSRATEDLVLLAVPDWDTRRRHPEAALKAQRPSPSAFRRAVEEVGERVRADLARGDQPVLFLSYSGHGASDDDGESYLALAGGRLTRTMLLDEVLATVKGAQVHLFIDACNAASMVDARGAFDEEIDTQSVRLGEATLARLFSDEGVRAPAGVGAFLASAHNAQAHEWTEVESGVFTHQAISGLLGAADINGDLRIEYGELHAFLSAANSDIRDPKARPAIVVSPPDGNANSVLLDLLSMRDVRWLVGDASHLGRFHVELESGERLLEANLGKGSRSVLALPRDAESYVVVADGEAAISTQAASIVPFDALQFSSPSKTARGPVERAYEKQMFRTPLTVAYYRGFMDSLGLPPTMFGAQRSLPGEEELSDGVSVAGLGSQPKDSGLPDREKRLRWRRTLFGTAGASAAASIASMAVSLNAKRSYDNASSQTEADALNDRYRRAAYGAIATGALAAGMAVGGAFIKIPSESGRYELSLGSVSKLRVSW